MNIMKDKLPKEFKEEMKELLKDEYEVFLASYDEERTNAIRINDLKANPDFFRDNKFFNIDYERDKIKWADLGYYISNDESPGKSPLHDAGAYYIQEPSAMSVVGMTQIKEGDKILDMCAAPGGKSTYILSELKGSGLLLSNEINSTRIKALGENLERFGAVNSTITNSDSKTLLKFFKGFFDKVFIDAPCSGQGMFRKDEYAIKDWSEEKLEECASIQREIIRDGFDMLKEGGILIYSTCTFSKRENEDIINNFLKDYQSAKLLEMDRIWPHRERGEGHFCARIKKTSQEEERGSLKKRSSKSKKVKTNSKKENSSKMKDYESFLKDYINKDSNFKRLMAQKKLKLKGDFVYLVDEEMLNLEGLKILRNGLLMGEIKKNRFEPSHSLAMALSPDDVKYALDLNFDDEDLKKYLRGEAISLEGKKVYKYSELDTENNNSRSWILVTINGISIGWGKESNGIMKNKYPKGLRRIIK